MISHRWIWVCIPLLTLTYWTSLPVVRVPRHPRPNTGDAPFGAEIYELVKPVTFFTLLSNANGFYLQQLLLQQKSVEMFLPGYKMHVLATTDLPAPTIAAMQDISIDVQVHKPLDETQIHAQPNWIHQLTKLKLWSLTEFEFICYADADVVFFNDRILQAVAACQALVFNDTVHLCAFEQGCEDSNTSHNRHVWGKPYIQASFFCLRPSKTMYTRLLSEVVGPFTNGSMKLLGKQVSTFTEQDALNVYFQNHIHCMDCSLKTQRDIVHGKGNMHEWLNRVPGPSIVNVLTKLRAIQAATS
jgi:hypothetical protein